MRLQADRIIIRRLGVGALATVFGPGVPEDGVLVPRRVGCSAISAQQGPPPTGDLEEPLVAALQAAVSPEPASPPPPSLPPAPLTFAALLPTPPQDAQPAQERAASAARSSSRGAKPRGAVAAGSTEALERGRWVCEAENCADDGGVKPDNYPSVIWKIHTILALEMSDDLKY